MDELKRYLKTKKTSCDGKIKEFREDINGETSVWKLCMPTGRPLRIVSSRMNLNDEKTRMERELAKLGHDIFYLNHELERDTINSLLIITKLLIFCSFLVTIRRMN